MELIGIRYAFHAQPCQQSLKFTKTFGPLNLVGITGGQAAVCESGTGSVSTPFPITKGGPHFPGGSNSGCTSP